MLNNVYIVILIIVLASSGIGTGMYAIKCGTDLRSDVNKLSSTDLVHKELERKIDIEKVERTGEYELLKNVIEDLKEDIERDRKDAKSRDEQIIEYLKEIKSSAVIITSPLSDESKKKLE